MSWTACYDDDCFIHRSDKEGSGWFPQKRRAKKSKPQVWLNATSDVNSPTCDEDSESYHNSNSDRQSICTEDQEFLDDSDENTLLEINRDEIPSWYPGHQFYGIVKERPPPGSKFTLDGGFVTPSGGYIPRELRKRVYEVQCEYRRRDPELDQSMRVNPEEFRYYPSEEQKERWHDAVPYFEEASAFHETQAQEKRAQEYMQKNMPGLANRRQTAWNDEEQREEKLLQQHLRVLAASQPVPRNQEAPSHDDHPMVIASRIQAIQHKQWRDQQQSKN